VQFQDEGLYECDTGEQRLTVALQVAGAWNPYNSLSLSLSVQTSLTTTSIALKTGSLAQTVACSIKKNVMVLLKW
jgi:hypothetical protein